MRNSVRFTQLEKQRRLEAQHVLNNPHATPQEKVVAQQQIAEVFRSAQARLDARKAKRAIGPPPDRSDFEDYEDYVLAVQRHRYELDKLAARRILDDPSATLAQRNRGRRKRLPLRKDSSQNFRRGRQQMNP